jgi:anti-sigma B factor antagonist
MADRFTRNNFGARARRSGPVAVVSVHGEIDIATGPRLEAVAKRALGAPPPEALLVDLDDCPFMDSTGLNFLLRTRNAFPGRVMVSCRPDSPVARMLYLTTRGLVDVFDSADDALLAASAAA